MYQRILLAYDGSESGQKALLDEVSKTLAGVSREQMAALIAALEKAGKATGDARSAALTKAAGHHEKIVLELKGLLAKFDAVRDLDGTAERLEKLARDEVEQSLSTSQLVYEAEHTNLVGRRDTPAGVLTYAEQRALEIGITIAGGAGIILLDEPTAGMSHREAEHAVALIRKISAGRTLVIIEHDMGVVFDLADRISVLVYGQIIASDAPAQIKANAAVQQAYLGTAVA